MKVFVATKVGQGKRDNDFCWTKEGELVAFGFECDGEDVDGNCGCRRSMSGIDSHKATTTFMVADKKRLTRTKFIEKLLKSRIKAGWIQVEGKVKEKDLAWVTEDVDELIRLAKYFPTGSIMEKRGEAIQVRSVKKRAK